MLAIVAENPIAFHAQNVNGLKSGYVLQLPDNTDDMLDSGKALAEVALQNREWQEGLATSDSGLRLVTDADLAEELPLTEPLEEINPLNGVSPTQRSMSTTLPWSRVTQIKQESPRWCPPYLS